MAQVVPSAYLAEILKDARARTLELVAGLDGDQLMGPKLDIVNPLLWEIGHLAWFHEHFALRALDGGSALLPGADALYDSSAVHHDARWELPLPSLAGTLDYMARVQDAMLERLDRDPAGEAQSYLYRLTTFHEDMHDEAFVWTRQTLGWLEPDFAAARGGPPQDAEAGPLPGDVEVPGGTFTLGSGREASFVFDNEKWAHAVEIEPFRIARAPVTNAEFAAFVADGGYRDPRFWDEDGWRWRTRAQAEHPVYWAARDGGWAERRFHRVAPLAPHRPVIHVNWYEVNAYCRWKGRRLPTEAEWEAAASGEPGGDGTLAAHRRTWPWGEAAPAREHANLDGRVVGTVDVAAHAAGDSAFGCRQMLGNVWEWTASVFEPYPGFSADAYRDYSAPWFGTRRVLRGGAWVTRSRMLNNRYRNFFTPERRDVFAGFRTVAL